MPSATHTAILSSQPPVSSGHVWDTSDASAGFPSGLNYVSYNDPTYGYQSGDTFAQTLSRAATKYGGNFILVVPNGFDVSLNDYAQATNTYGFYHQYLQGLLCVGGPTQARIKMNADTLSSTQVTSLNNQTTGTTQVSFGRVGFSAPVYVGGITFEGSSQQVNKLQGVNSFYSGAGSIWQYCRILGAGYANNTSPPGETFSWQELRSTNLLFRNCEIDGRLRSDTAAVGSSGFVNPTMGTRIAGMWGANGATNITIDNCYLHDSARSGVTFSYAGATYDSVGQPNSPTNTVTTNYLHSSYNDFHVAGQSFTGVNHEAVMGTVTHNYPTLEMDPTGFGVAWNNGHMTWTGTSETTGTLKVVEPTWTGSAQNAPGFFSIRTYGWYTGSDQGYTNMSTPVVIKNGVSLQPWVRTSSTTAPNGVTPATHFAWNKG